MASRHKCKAMKRGIQIKHLRNRDIKIKKRPRRDKRGAKKSEVGVLAVVKRRDNLTEGLRNESKPEEGQKTVRDGGKEFQ